VLRPRATAKLGVGVKPRAPDQAFLSRDGTRMALSLSESDKTQVWDLSGEPKKFNELAGVAKALSPDGKLLVRSGKPKPEVVNADTGAVVCTLQVKDTRPPLAYHFRTPATLTAVKRSDAEDGPEELIVREFHTADGKEMSRLPLPGTSSRSQVSLGVNGGEELAVGDAQSRQVQVWNVVTKKLVREFRLPAEPRESPFRLFAASADGRWLMADVSQGAVVVDTRSGAPVSGPPQKTVAARFIPGADLIAARVVFSDDDHQPHEGWVAYHIERRETVAFLPTGGAQIWFSGDGTVVVTASDAGELRVWDLKQIPGVGR
jgi:WD40 repeat protein